jgi:hypothetical protein
MPSLLMTQKRQSPQTAQCEIVIKQMKEEYDLKDSPQPDRPLSANKGRMPHKTYSLAPDSTGPQSSSSAVCMSG